MIRARKLQQITRWVALWFALSLGVAVASPLVQPRLMSMICSGSGVMALMVQTDDGIVPVGQHTLDCPLCANLGAPPPLMLAPTPEAQAAGLEPIAPKPIQMAQRLAGAWQARAPPTLN